MKVGYKGVYIARTGFPDGYDVEAGTIEKQRRLKYEFIPLIRKPDMIIFNVYFVMLNI